MVAGGETKTSLCLNVIFDDSLSTENKAHSVRGKGPQIGQNGKSSR